MITANKRNNDGLLNPSNKGQNDRELQKPAPKPTKIDPKTGKPILED